MCYVLYRQSIIIVLVFLIEEVIMKDNSLLIPCEKSFPCSSPQKRSLFLRDELQISENIAPKMAVLHRCDSGTGCCEQHETICKVVDSLDITVDIFVRNNLYKFEKRTVLLKNHTQCACQSIFDTPK